VNVSYTVTASGGEFELKCPSLGPNDSMRFSPTHEGLLAMCAVLESLSAEKVYTSGLDSQISGLPEGYDARGFVEMALTLSQLGWHSAPGGAA
jgi:hypothetical protein